MKKTGNAYGVIKVFKESMLLRLFLTYWGRRVCILKVFMFLKKNLTQQDTNNFSITNRLGRVFFLVIQKRLEHPSHIYRISHLLPLNPPSIVVPKSITSSNDTNSYIISGFSYASNISYESNSIIIQMFHLFLVLMAILKN